MCLAQATRAPIFLENFAPSANRLLYSAPLRSTSCNQLARSVTPTGAIALARLWRRRLSLYIMTTMNLEATPSCSAPIGGAATLQVAI